MSDTTFAIIVALVAVGFFCLGFLWGDVRQYRVYLKRFIEHIDQTHARERAALNSQDRRR